MEIWACKASQVFRFQPSGSIYIHIKLFFIQAQQISYGFLFTYLPYCYNQFILCDRSMNVISSQHHILKKYVMCIKRLTKKATTTFNQQKIHSGHLTRVWLRNQRHGLAWLFTTPCLELSTTEGSQWWKKKKGFKIGVFVVWMIQLMIILLKNSACSGKNSKSSSLVTHTKSSQLLMLYFDAATTLHLKKNLYSTTQKKEKKD